MVVGWVRRHLAKEAQAYVAGKTRPVLLFTRAASDCTYHKNAKKKGVAELQG